jgi:hypothetical protein
VEWVIVHELYKTKSPKVLVVSIDDKPYPWGHQAFKYIAPARAIAVPPSPLLHNYFYDLAYLPFRQLKLFAALPFSEAFGLKKQFKPEIYAQTATDLTNSHRMPDGKWIDMEHPVSRAVLEKQARIAAAEQERTLVPRALAAIVEADDHAYVQEIAREAAAHGTRLLFVFVPSFDGPTVIKDRAFYEQYGRILDNSDLSQRDQLYMDWSHLNHAGALIVSDRVAAAVAPDL